MYVALLFLIGIFKVSCQSFCQSAAESNNVKVATFCKNSVASGSSAIIDGYAAHGTDTDKTCPCSATVSIPNNGTSSLAFSAFFSLHPQYNGCGSSIDVRVNNSGQSTRIRCTIAGSISVNNGDNVLIDLKKESSPEDTRYCMKLQFSDPDATLTVKCNGENFPAPPTPSTTTTTTTATTTVLTQPSTTIRTELLSTSTLSSTILQKITDSFTSSNPLISSTTEAAISSDASTTETNPSSVKSTQVFETSSTTKASVADDISTPTTTAILDEISSTDMSSKLPETSTTDYSTSSSMDEQNPTTMKMMSTYGGVILQTEQLSTKLTTNSMADTTVIETTTPIVIKQTTKTAPTSTSNQSTTSTSNQSTTSKQSTSTTSTSEASTSSASTSTSIKTTSQLQKTESTTEYGISAKANKLSTEELKIDETTVAVQLTSPAKLSTTDERSTQTSQSTPRQTTNKPGVTGSSKDDDFPIEVVAPVASVGGLIIILVIICIVVGLRRNGCGCNEDTLPHSNTLVEKASTEIKNREKDTYVNPLYDDISLTGKSDRSDRDSMMQEIPSDGDSEDSYRLPESTKIDGELWTHL